MQGSDGCTLTRHDRRWDALAIGLTAGAVSGYGSLNARGNTDGPSRGVVTDSTPRARAQFGTTDACERNDRSHDRYRVRTDFPAFTRRRR